MLTEKLFWLFGASVNLFLISKLFIRPSLWSTNNSFIVAILVLNFFYLLLQVFLVNDVKETTSSDDAFVQGLENLFIDNFKSILCSTKYISDFMYSSLTLFSFLGTIFIRSMMIKHAENICLDGFLCKRHQARLSIIGILVGFSILTVSIGGTIGIFIHKLFPFDFLRVRYCRGVSILYRTDDMHKLFSQWLSRLISLVLISIAILTCQVRILRFRRSHNQTYFSHFRRNIATVDQLIFAAYLKIALAIIKEAIFYNRAINIETVLKVGIILDCIVIPCYWMYSAKQDFREFWSGRTVFEKKLRNQQFVHLHENKPRLCPRRPNTQETSFFIERSHPACKGQLEGRFFYGIKIKRNK